MNNSFLLFCILLIFPPLILAQQNYSGIVGCNTNPSTTPLYACNGKYSSCHAFLIFTAQPPYLSVSNISFLMNSNPYELARINYVTVLAVFPENKEVIVPLNCSCFGQYYQANTKFLVTPTHGTYYNIANDAYQGLVTCDSLKRANQHDQGNLNPGIELCVPLRCACPTNDQVNKGTRYLLTYLISNNDSIVTIAHRFNVTKDILSNANGLKKNTIIFSFTTILVPLPTQPSTTQTIHHEIESPIQPLDPIRKTSKRKFHERLGIVAASSLVFLSIVLIVIFLVHKKKFKKHLSEKMKHILPENIRVQIASYEHNLKVYSFEEINKATGNFSEENQIKGSVYRAVFSNKVLAIKKTRKDVSKEVNTLKKINHFNLIKLEGLCKQHGSWYLIFEYMENQSLRKWLSKGHVEGKKSWIKRIQIALDVSNGLHYLHSFTKPVYVHKDIKSSNVLLNYDFRAKISNFSHARSAVKDSNLVASTTYSIGTRGYIAPESMDTGEFSRETDIYAFGVVLLEIVSGKSAVYKYQEREVLLAEEVICAMEKENAEVELDLFVDPCLKGSKGLEVVLRVLKLSVACLTLEPSRRPSMEEVVSNLMKILADIQKIL